MDKQKAKTIINNHFRILSITFISLLFVFSLFFYFFPKFYFSAFPLLFISVSSIFFILDYFFIKGILKKEKKFIIQYKLISTIKFLVLLLLLTIFLLVFRKDILKIGVSFILLFFVFLSVQTISFLKIFKKL